LMIGDGEVENRFASLLGGFARALQAALGQVTRLGCRFELQPAIEAIEVVLGGNRGAPRFCCRCQRAINAR
jgi:hypothetical protein